MTRILQGSAAPLLEPFIKADHRGVIRLRGHVSDDQFFVKRGGGRDRNSTVVGVAQLLLCRINIAFLNRTNKPYPLDTRRLFIKIESGNIGFKIVHSQIRCNTHKGPYPRKDLLIIANAQIERGHTAQRQFSELDLAFELLEFARVVESHQTYKKADEDQQSATAS